MPQLQETTYQNLPWLETIIKWIWIKHPKNALRWYS